MLSNPMPHCNSVMQFPLMLLFLEFFFFFSLWRLYSIGEADTENHDSLCFWGKNVLFERYETICGNLTKESRAHLFVGKKKV